MSIVPCLRNPAAQVGETQVFNEIPGWINDASPVANPAILLMFFLHFFSFFSSGHPLSKSSLDLGPFCRTFQATESRFLQAETFQSNPVPSSHLRLAGGVLRGQQPHRPPQPAFLLPWVIASPRHYCARRYYHFNFYWGKITPCHSAQVPITKWINCNNCCQQNKGLVAFLSRFQRHWELYTNVPIGQAGRNQSEHNCICLSLYFVFKG